MRCHLAAGLCQIDTGKGDIVNDWDDASLGHGGLCVERERKSKDLQGRAVSTLINWHVPLLFFVLFPGSIGCYRLLYSERSIVVKVWNVHRALGSTTGIRVM